MPTCVPVGVGAGHAVERKVEGKRFLVNVSRGSLSVAVTDGPSEFFRGVSAIAPNASVSTGYQATHTGHSAAPGAFTVDGAAFTTG